MPNFTLVKHTHTPEDQYIKELALIEFKILLPNNNTTPIRIYYARKQGKDGSLFWDTFSTGISMWGKKEYFKAALYDSTFLSDEIKEYLNDRPWDKIQPVDVKASPSAFQPQPAYQKPPEQEQLPF